MLTFDGIHAVDTLRWLGGGDVTSVTSHVRTRYVPGPVANEIVAQVEFASGAVGQLHYGCVAGQRMFRAEIHGRNVSAAGQHRDVGEQRRRRRDSIIDTLTTVR